MLGIGKVLFKTPSVGIDTEDGAFKDSLYKTMLAIGLGQNLDALADIRPTRNVDTWLDREDWLAVYWKQICAEIWNYHGGDWRALLALRASGTAILAGVTNMTDSYRASFTEYFAASKIAVESPTGKLAGIAFTPFLVSGNKSLLEVVNQNCDLLKGMKDRYEKLAESIRRALPMLEPRRQSFSADVRVMLVEDIVNRINPVLVEETLSAFKKGEV